MIASGRVLSSSTRSCRFQLLPVPNMLRSSGCGEATAKTNGTRRMLPAGRSNQNCDACVALIATLSPGASRRCCPGLAG
jgi:hypothetical protein